MEIKGQRKLSFYQSKEWMDKIAKKRKYKWDFPKGEEHPRAKLNKATVNYIRSISIMTRFSAQATGEFFGIHPSYVYHLRARYRWKHI